MRIWLPKDQGTGDSLAGPAQGRLLALLPLHVRSRGTVLALCVAAGVVVFGVDLLTPPRIADSALYIPVVLASLWLRDRWATVLIAVLASAAIVVASVVGPPGVLSPLVQRVNQAISLGLIWTSAVVVLAINHVLDYIEALVRDREMLLREMKHRLKNHLGMVSGLLSLQSEGIQDAKARAALEETHDRVLAMALLHEQLYQSLETGLVRLPDYLRRLVEVFEAGHRVRVVIDCSAEDVHSDVDRAIPCGLIVTELLTNAVKHAFDGHPGEIGMALHQYGGQLELCVWDAGKGLPAGFDWEHSSSLGLKLVHLLLHRLHGSCAVKAPTGGGTCFTITFPVSGLAEEA